MDIQSLVNDIEIYSDLELAVLLCLIAKQHCLLTTEKGLVDYLAAEIVQIVSKIFKLSYAVLSPEDFQNVDRFCESILDSTQSLEIDHDRLSEHDPDHVADIHSRLAAIHMHGSSHSRFDPSALDNRMVVNVIIAKEFELASQDVQVQAVELIRRQRIYSRTTVHSAPKVFLFLPIISTSKHDISLNSHLNDTMYMSHHHDENTGFPNLTEMDDRSQNDEESWQAADNRQIEHNVIDRLRTMGEATSVIPEIRRYLQDIIAFLRLERGVDGGITPFATKSVLALAKYLAPLHGIDYVTPSLIALAMKKIYPHRIFISSPERDRSVQYGTGMVAAKEYLAECTPENVIESAIARVDCPV